MAKLTKKEEAQKAFDENNSPFKKMLAESDLIKIPKTGEIVKGKIIDMSRSEIRIDIEGLTTGIVRGREFYDESNEYSDLKVGDEVEATVIELENENGEMELSFRFAGHQKAWDLLFSLKNSGEIVKATVTDANRLARLFKDPARCAYSDQNVVLLTEADAGRAGILAALDDLANTPADATVVVYFSGH
ncbi:MAG: S1 RNA-binding domain-containing protein, partial [Candidatus Parcubacteria bacterium]|nr:S1 RNA-binding domain-containing protein [Candidatus Parcubacteria bacterium]